MIDARIYLEEEDTGNDFLADDFDFNEPSLNDIHFGEDLFSFITTELLDSDLNENFINNKFMFRHFIRHCIGTSDSRSSRQDVLYDFEKAEDYGGYERALSRRVANSNLDIIDMNDAEWIIKCFHKLFEGNKTIVFLKSCGFKKDGTAFDIAMHSFSNDVTTNYPHNTISIQIMASSNHRTITVYAVDANYLENKFNNICAKNNINQLPKYEINH